MALIAIAADKGSPGVTTTAVALSAVWPRRTLLAEADPAGGDLIYRSAAANGGPLDPNTGMVSLAATARRGIAAEQLWDHAQGMAGGLDVLVGLRNSDQSAGLAGVWPTLGRAFSALAASPSGAADVIADCGRIAIDSGGVELLSHASLLLLVSRTEPEHLARVRDRAAALSTRLHGSQRGAAQLGTPVIGVVLIAEPSGSAKMANQVNEMLSASQSGARVFGVLADDQAGAEQLAGRRRGRVDKSMLVRSARKIASDLYGTFGASLLAPETAPAAAGQSRELPPQGQQQGGQGQYGQAQQQGQYGQQQPQQGQYAQPQQGQYAQQRQQHAQPQHAQPQQPAQPQPQPGQPYGQPQPAQQQPPAQQPQRPQPQQPQQPRHAQPPRPQQAVQQPQRPQPARPQQAEATQQIRLQQGQNGQAAQAGQTAQSAQQAQPAQPSQPGHPDPAAAPQPRNGHSDPDRTPGPAPRHGAA
ncbi:hypothetical protein [Streptomyces boninensis]|uniref:hypothetical protein n=1 Tax=Streptomyces boninensis TaxID=2039455 RepID=UPI003B21786B